MLRLILLTVAALFGVLALFGTPEFSGTNAGTIPQPGAELIAPPRAAPPMRRSSQAATPPDILIQAALAAPASTPAFEGPKLRPSPEHTASTLAAHTVHNSAAQLFVTSDAVNMRSKADSSASVVAKLSRGAAMSALGPVDGAWVEVEGEGQRGFVSARYLSQNPPS